MDKFSKSYYLNAFGYGVLGSLFMSVLMALLRWSNLSEFNFSMFLGSALTQSFSAQSFFMGFIWHLINGGIFGTVYAGGFRWLDKRDYGLDKKARTGKGLVFGLVHWLLFSLVMALSPNLHPLIPSEIYPPGLFAINYGVITSLSALGLHLIFGYIVGNGMEGRSFDRKRPSFRNKHLPKKSSPKLRGRHLNPSP